MHKLAPHLVVPEKMILPLVDGGTYGSWLTSVGLKVYDVLAAVEGEDKRKMLNQKEALVKEPLLPKHKLKGAGYYAEYRTDDARLTLELIKTAINYNAKPINYSKSYYSFSNPNNVIEKYVFELIINTNTLNKKIFRKIENNKKCELIQESDNIKYNTIKDFSLKIVKVPYNINFEYETYSAINHNLYSFNHKDNDIYIEFSQNSSGFAICNSIIISLDLSKLCITPPD